MPEPVIPKLQKAEVEPTKGHWVAEVAWKLRIGEQTHFRRRKEYGHLSISQTLPTLIPSSLRGPLYQAIEEPISNWVFLPIAPREPTPPGDVCLDPIGDYTGVQGGENSSGQSRMF